MNIQEAREQIKNAMIAYFTKDEFGRYAIPLERQRPVFLLGPPGIGKTAIVEQIAQELHVGLVSYSMTHHTRQSALGLPFITREEFDGEEYSVSEYTMSEIIAAVYKLRRETGCREGILFLDEVNCVSETLAPSMLQFLQYKIFGTHRLPQGWIVVTAGNPPEYNKSVREYDMATWDRLKRVEVEPDYTAWKTYAGHKGLHGAVLTFLEIKKDCFYVVEAGADRKSFVTARGWEDLSEMLRLYERNSLPVDLNLIGQYLQNPRIAKEFSVYYDLYNKYRSDYQVEEILSGTASQEILERAQSARFDERLSLLGLLLDGVGAEMRGAVERDGALQETRSLLRGVKKDLAEKSGSGEALLRICAEEERKKLRTGEQAGSMDPQAVYSCNYAIRFLEEVRSALLREDPELGGEEAFGHIKAAYDRHLADHKAGVKRVQRRLEHLFDFSDRVFGDGQETVILVTELTVRGYCARFISRFGCEPYFRHNRDLLFDERKKEILSELADLGL